jgi:hypothetical protein
MDALTDLHPVGALNPVCRHYYGLQPYLEEAGKPHFDSFTRSRETAIRSGMDCKNHHFFQVKANVQRGITNQRARRIDSKGSHE